MGKNKSEILNPSASIFSNFTNSIPFRISLLSFILYCLGSSALAQAQNVAGPTLDVRTIMASPQFSNSIQLILALSLISLIPFFLISITSFLRIIIVLSIIRTAIGTAQIPPNPVLIGLALFTTMFIMNPVWEEVNTTAITPYNQKKISQMEAFNRGMKPLSGFMLRQTRERDIALFVQFANSAWALVFIYATFHYSIFNLSLTRWTNP